MRGHRRGCHADDGGVTGCLAIVLIVVFAMPLVGGYLLLTGKDDESKAIGFLLLVVGIIIWIVAGIH